MDDAGCVIESTFNIYCYLKSFVKLMREITGVEYRRVKAFRLALIPPFLLQTPHSLLLTILPLLLLHRIPHPLRLTFLLSYAFR